MNDGLTTDDPRYRQMFDVGEEARFSSGRVEGDLTPAMNALRERGAVLHGSLQTLLGIHAHDGQWDRERDHYTLTSWKHCERGFRENLLFSSEAYLESPGVRSFGHSLLQMVGDEHRRYRGVVQPMFVKPKVVSWWGPKLIHDAVESLMERLVGHERADLNLELCARLPVYVVTRMIGMQGEDALTFRHHLQRSTLGVRKLPESEVQASALVVSTMLKDLIVRRRAEPADDVISALAHNDLKLPDGTARKLTENEVFGYCRLIMLAGGGTTWRQLGITLHALLSEYRFWEACRADRSLIGAAIEESARWMPTDPVFSRLMTADVDLDGTVVPSGARVDLCVGSANRDPQRWDQPDRYDLHRPAKYHVGFGLGPHQCLGQNVAKQEMICAINALMNRFPNMTLDPDQPAAVLQGGVHQRGMTAVPVRLV
jgi:cytochrome P450